MKVLVCNVGSTSLKFKLYDMPACTVLATGGAERVGSSDDAIFRYENVSTGYAVKAEKQSIPQYRVGIRMFLDALTAAEGGALRNVREVDRVGYKATLSKGHYSIHELTSDVLQGMHDWMSLAPLHNAAYLETIQMMREELPEAMFIGVFETEFHRDIPLERKLYGVPYEWYEKYGVQRLGYHSASHGFIADTLSELHGGKPYKAISCHLGGSASVCAIQNGKSVDTSFGMSLQSGLVHATRVGDMDCDLYAFLQSQGLSEAEIHEGFEKTGGMLGLSGVSGDLRYIEQAAASGDKRADLALNVFVAGIVHYIGAFYVDLEGLDDLVFTAGIGEKSSVVRSRVCQKLSCLGIRLDEAKNQQVNGRADITGAGSLASVLVIPTNEELGIARRTYSFQQEPHA